MLLSGSDNLTRRIPAIPSLSEWVLLLEHKHLSTAEFRCRFSVAEGYVYLAVFFVRGKIENKKIIFSEKKLSSVKES